MLIFKGEGKLADDLTKKKKINKKEKNRGVGTRKNFIIYIK